MATGAKPPQKIGDEIMTNMGGVATSSTPTTAVRMKIERSRNWNGRWVIV
ncbi:MAG TPA: hypothetical protein VMV69_12435 [Pirellulales bacterium]|nr:hypothetical protein [Pirellulales bacterium]